jgi:hypothetical protein
MNSNFHHNQTLEDWSPLVKPPKRGRFAERSCRSCDCFTGRKPFSLASGTFTGRNFRSPREHDFDHFSSVSAARKAERSSGTDEKDASVAEGGRFQVN